MRFDVRLPIGLLFLIIGAMVGLCSVFGDPKRLQAQSPGGNIDLVWGLAMAAFGAVMLAMAILARRNAPPSTED